MPCSYAFSLFVQSRPMEKSAINLDVFGSVSYTGNFETSVLSVVSDYIQALLFPALLLGALIPESKEA